MAISDNIEHIIVLMLENRSFDQILGALEQGKEFDGINASSPNSNSYSGREYFQEPSAASASPQDPRHDLSDVLSQMDVDSQGNPLMDGFVRSYAEAYSQLPADQFGQVMEYYPSGSLPVLHELAEEFTVCDRWFSSLPGPTWPNRLFAMSGTSLGKVTMPSGVMNLNLHWYDQPTIFDRLNERKIPWKVYFGDIAVSMILVHEWKPENAILHRPMDEFYSDIKDAELPSFAWIEPSYFPPSANDYHPPHDVFEGEKLVASVYNSLRADEKLWNSSLLVLLFDEHGGFYDHVPPPSALPPDQHQDQWTFDKLGPRVPAVLVSPWVGRGVIHDILDHTSLLRFLTDKWDLEPLGSRAAQASSFERALLSSSRSDTPEQVAYPPSNAPQNNPIQTLTEHEKAMISLSHALESMAAEDAKLVAARGQQDQSGPTGQIISAVDRVNGFLRHAASKM